MENNSQLDITDSRYWHGLRPERIVPLFAEIEKLNLKKKSDRKKNAEIIKKVHDLMKIHIDSLYQEFSNAISKQCFLKDLIEDAEKEISDAKIQNTTLSPERFERLKNLKSVYNDYVHFYDTFDSIKLNISEAYIKLNYDEKDSDNSKELNVTGNTNETHDQYNI